LRWVKDHRKRVLNGSSHRMQTGISVDRTARDEEQPRPSSRHKKEERYLIPSSFLSSAVRERVRIGEEVPTIWNQAGVILPWARSQ
jgi:hypothetical protein